MLEEELIKTLIRNAVENHRVLRLKSIEEFYYVKPHYVVKITEEDIEKLKEKPLVLILKECSIIFLSLIHISEPTRPY